jgi:DNA repair exonuclease SbcCD ATPase subunit
VTPLGRTFVAGCLLLGVLAGVGLAAERVRRERPSSRKQLQQVEQQIRQSRSVTKRVQRDPRASAELKQQARALDQLLDARERTLARLGAQYRDFLSRHKGELDELDDLRQRALAIDERLDQARKELVQANQGDLEELKRTSAQSRELVDSLRGAYEADRRSRRTR